MTETINTTEIKAAQTIPETEKIQLIKARIGQGLFRNQLLAECPFCPITMVDYPRFLIASHIKPWRDSSNFERLDGKNGILFTPTFDKLFDAGYISFDNQKRLNISPWLSQLNRTRFNIQDGNVYPNFPITGRESYLEYHRNVIFKGTL